MKRLQMSKTVRNSFYLCYPSANPFEEFYLDNQAAKNQLDWLQNVDGGEFCWYVTTFAEGACNELWFSREEDMVLYQMTWC